MFVYDEKGQRHQIGGSDMSSEESVKSKEEFSFGSSGSKKWLWIILAIVLLVIIGFVVYKWVWPKNNKMGFGKQKWGFRFY